MRTNSPDLIHLHTPNPTMLLPLALIRPKVPLVITHHSDIVRQKMLRYLHDPFERVVYGRASLIFSDSAPYIDGSLTLQRYRNKVQTLPLGLDLSTMLEPSARSYAFAKELQRNHGSPLWLSVGRLVYYKGLEVALEALRGVAGKLVIIGTGPNEAALKDLARKLDVSSRVVWLGHVSPEELIGAYYAANALWFPSIARSEGFGLVQVEAMACSCPVINTAVPASGVSWVSQHEQTGLTVAMADPAALAAAGRRILEEPGLRSNLARQARHRAVSEFDHRTMAQRSVQFYRRLFPSREDHRRNGSPPR